MLLFSCSSSFLFIFFCKGLCFMFPLSEFGFSTEYSSDCFSCCFGTFFSFPFIVVYHPCIFFILFLKIVLIILFFWCFWVSRFCSVHKFLSLFVIWLLLHLPHWNIITFLFCLFDYFVFAFYSNQQDISIRVSVVVMAVGDVNYWLITLIFCRMAF